MSLVAPSLLWPFTIYRALSLTSLFKLLSNHVHGKQDCLHVLDEEGKVLRE